MSGAVLITPASQPNEQARRLFGGIADSYEIPAEVLSFAQYGRWRRFAVAALRLRPGALVLDVATGTGLFAGELRRRCRARVVGLDLTFAMLRAAPRDVSLLAARAEQLPFPEGTFDALTFSYLLRYVSNPAATIKEQVRVLRPGAPMASVEFGVPSNPLVRFIWHLHVSHVLPSAAGLISREWGAVGRFLGPSITRFNDVSPPPRIEQLWRDAGMCDVHTRRLSFGAGVVTWGTKAT